MNRYEIRVYGKGFENVVVIEANTEAEAVQEAIRKTRAQGHYKATLLPRCDARTNPGIPTSLEAQFGDNITD